MLIQDPGACVLWVQPGADVVQQGQRCVQRLPGNAGRNIALRIQ